MIPKKMPSKDAKMIETRARINVFGSVSLIISETSFLLWYDLRK